jgi:hypothetical protein
LTDEGYHCCEDDEFWCATDYSCHPLWLPCCDDYTEEENCETQNWDCTLFHLCCEEDGETYCPWDDECIPDSWDCCIDGETERCYDEFGV